MSKFLSGLKNSLLKVLLPIAVDQAETSFEEYLKALATKQPKKFALVMQSLYPGFKGILQPLAKSSKTPFDNMAVDPTVEMFEGLMEELGIQIPVVVPIDFESETDIPDQTETAVEGAGE